MYQIVPNGQRQAVYDFDEKSVTQATKDALANTVLNAVEQFFSLPDTQERFERWKQERRNANESPAQSSDE